MSFEPVDIYALDTTPQNNPIPNVTVKVLSQDGTIIYGIATTDSSGHVGFLLPTEMSPFQARFFQFGVTFQNPQLLSIAPAPVVNSFNIYGQLTPAPVSTDARLCVAYGYFRDVSGAPAPGTEIHFIAKFNPLWVDGAAILKERVIRRTDERGYVQVELFRGAQYDVTIVGEEEITRHIDVPDQPNINIVDLIFPIVESVVFSPPGPWSIPVGGQLAVSMTIYASDGENLGTGIGDAFVQTSDDTILGYSISPVGLVLIGIAPGTAQISVSRADLSIVHIPNLPVQGSPVQATVY